MAEYKKEKVFVGRVNLKQTQWGDKIKLSLNVDDLKRIHAQILKRGDGKAEVVIHQSKAGKWYAEVDTYMSADRPAPDMFAAPAPQTRPAGRFDDTLAAIDAEASARLASVAAAKAPAAQVEDDIIPF